MFLRIAIIAWVVLLGACSATKNEQSMFRDRKYDYRIAEEGQRMQVPAHLDSQSIIDYYPIPDISPFAEKEIIINPPLPTGMLLDIDQRVRLQRLQEREWILIQATPSQVWVRLKYYLQQQNWPILMEQGAQGELIATSAQGFLRFQLNQGFQHNSSELSLRVSQDPSIIQTWPAVSADAEQEHELLLALATFLADPEQPAYSFVAYNISTQQRLFSDFDAQGARYILLKSDSARAKASLEKALLHAEFIIEQNDANTLLVQYAPQSNKTLKRGFWQRIFRIKPKPFDASILYAGHRYQFTLTGKDDGQYISVRVLEQNVAIAQQLKEANQQLVRIRGLIN